MWPFRCFSDLGFSFHPHANYIRCSKPHSSKAVVLAFFILKKIPLLGICLLSLSRFACLLKPLVKHQRLDGQSAVTAPQVTIVTSLLKSAAQLPLLLILSLGGDYPKFQLLNLDISKKQIIPSHTQLLKYHRFFLAKIKERTPNPYLQ